MSVVVFGGYGTFGSIVCRALAQRGISVAVAGRDGARAGALAESLPAVVPPHRAIAADLRKLGEVRRAIDGARVAACCAGPFAEIGDFLLEACLERRCHYVDIAEERAYVARVRALDGRFRAGGITAVTGCSTLPALSGALAIAAHDGEPAAPIGVLCALVLGNKNPKGRAAVESVVRTLGRSFRAPQGELRGFGGREVVELPGPFGRRAVYDFESPEYDLLPDALGVARVRVKVCFELRAATATFALLARLSSGYGRLTAAVLDRVGSLVRPFGVSGGAVLAEVEYPDGQTRRAALSAATDGQRMAALPCVYVAEALVRGEWPSGGAMVAYEFLGAEALLARLVADGCSLTRDAAM